jgi:hypothetical protein
MTDLSPASRPQGRGTIRWGIFLLIVVLSSWLLTKNTDFRLYWSSVKGFFEGAPAYGFNFVTFQLYLYHPVTFLLLRPITFLPLRAAGFCWMAGAWLATTATLLLAVRTYKLRFNKSSMAAASVLLAAYTVVALRNGNVQPYLVAMLFVALLLAESHGPVSAVLMAVVITFKVWPAMFLPWFLPRGRRVVLVWLVPATLLLWLAPLLVWTPTHYRDLLTEWYGAVSGASATKSEFYYFPGQSLRGVLLRYLSPLDSWRTGFPDIHLVSLSRDVVIWIWEGAAATLYIGACGAMLCANRCRRWVWDGMAFVLYTVLQPYTVKGTLISLGPAVLVAAALYSRPPGAADGWLNRAARRLFLGACAVSAVGVAAQFRPLLHLLAACGLDFLVAVLLLTALWFWSIVPEVEFVKPAGSRVECRAAGERETVWSDFRSDSQVLNE